MATALIELPLSQCDTGLPSRQDRKLLDGIYRKEGDTGRGWHLASRQLRRAAARPLDGTGRRADHRLRKGNPGRGGGHPTL